MLAWAAILVLAVPKLDMYASTHVLLGDYLNVNPTSIDTSVWASNSLPIATQTKKKIENEGCVKSEVNNLYC